MTKWVAWEVRDGVLGSNRIIIYTLLGRGKGGRDLSMSTRARGGKTKKFPGARAQHGDCVVT